ncbi:MAG: ABC transporter ATP-binding protein [Nitrospinaceae bacterium]
MVRLQSISKSYDGKPVLRDLSLEIAAGERFILLGRSGGGKTTLLRLFAGFENPDSGSIILEGNDVVPLPVEARPVGFIFQNYALFPHMTVYDNIAVGPRVRGVAEEEIARRIGGLLEITHLQGLRGAFPVRLSGGEAQRVAIARAIINEPKILLLDEPLSALDATLRQQLREELKEMQQTLGITFLFVTHDQEEAMSLATRMGILEDGRLLQVGTPSELYHHPVSPFVAGFLGEVNRLPGIVSRHSGNQVIVSLGGQIEIKCATPVPRPAGQPVECFIRPEKVSFHSGERDDPSLNRLDAKIMEKSFYGSRTRYKFELNTGQSLTVPAEPGRAGEEPPHFHTGDPVQLRFAAKDVLLFDRTEGAEKITDAPLS